MKKSKSGEGCIYLLTNLTNGRRYVGQDQTGDPENHRWKHHIKVALNGESNLYLHHAIRKACKASKGKTLGFSAEILWSGAIEKLNAKEIYYVKKLHSWIDDPNGDHSYNLTTGGERTVYSGSSRKKMSRARAERWKDETYREAVIRANAVVRLDPAWKAVASKKREAIWRNKTLKERKAIGRNISLGLLNRPFEKRAASGLLLSAKAKEEWSIPGFRKAHIARIRAGHAKRSVKDRRTTAILRSASLVKVWAQKTPEERKVVGAAIKAGHARRTPAEQLAYCESHRLGALRRYAKLSSEERITQWRVTHPHGNRPA